MKKRILSLFLALSLALTLAIPAFSADGMAFTDVTAKNWFYSYVRDLYTSGVIDGTSPTTFTPQGTVTVGQALKMILLAAGYEEQAPTTTHWASGYYHFASQRGFLPSGFSLSLNDPIPRLQIAKIAVAALGLSGANHGASPFSDTTDQAAVILYDYGIFTGVTTGNTTVFNPKDNITRAEMSAVTWRILQYQATLPPVEDEPAADDTAQDEPDTSASDGTVSSGSASSDSSTTTSGGSAADKNITSGSSSSSGSSTSSSSSTSSGGSSSSGSNSSSGSSASSGSDTTSSSGSSSEDDTSSGDNTSSGDDTTASDSNSSSADSSASSSTTTTVDPDAPYLLFYNKKVYIKSDVPRRAYNKSLFSYDDNGFLTYSGTAYSTTTGIDVSRYQKDIDWAAVKAAGIDFAIIRVGYRGYGSAGTLVKDVYFKKNIEGALANGIEVGVYFFSQAITEEEAIEEAQYTLNLIQGYDLTYPVVFDWEPYSNISTARTNGLDDDTLTKCAIAFCETVQDAGYQPMVYSNQTYFYLHFDLSQLKDYPLWLAQYTSKPTFYYNFQMWQYSCKGSIDGIEGDVDVNLAFFKN